MMKEWIFLFELQTTIYFSQNSFLQVLKFLPKTPKPRTTPPESTDELGELSFGENPTTYYHTAPPVVENLLQPIHFVADSSSMSWNIRRST